MPRRAAISWVVWLLAGAAAPMATRAGDAAATAFFEQKIRPVLVEHCYSCHSADAKKLKGGLRVDSRAGLLAGGDTGPSIVPGKPAESVLLDALRYEGPEMPPKGKLPEAVVADFERWVRMGAPDPRTDRPGAVRAGIDLDAGRRFWAYQPPRRDEPPAVADASWPRTAIDRFVLAGLEAKGLRPVYDASKADRARRLALDLTGLPLGPEEVDAFVQDTSPAAYERLVDRLLASPRFGERWGRHWLDVARFGESLTLRGFVLNTAWRYRDYVIEAFNADLPFDRFVREQIAGDLLPAAKLAERRRQLVATAFLALGNTNLEEQDKKQLRMDVVDEQLDTLGKAFLAQTIGCARCHDHKFDPIPTRDYYALAGILGNARALDHANVSQWIERPLPEAPEREAILRRHEQAVATLEAKISAERKKSVVLVKNSAGGNTVLTGDLPGVVVDDSSAKRVGQWQESRFVPNYVGRGYLHDANQGKGEKSLTFQPEIPKAGLYEVRLAYSPASNRARAVPVTIFSADGEKVVTVDMRAEPPIDARFIALGQFHFEQNNQGYVLISNEGTHGFVSADALVFVPAAQAAATGKPGRSEAGLLRALEAELKQLRDHGPKREKIVSVLEEPHIADTRIHVRGSVHTLGAVVPRGVLQVAAPGRSIAMPSNESGRRELADWLASAENPLTARVFVNRVWHWLFGEGLVRTTDNFGTTGEPPSHPELLDALTVQFIEDGWSVKVLIRRIVLSRTYGLATTDDRQALAADPENRLLWRMSRRRLDAECLRDTMLWTSGALSDEMGGPSFPTDLKSDYGFKSDAPRRSVYVPAFRNALPELFEVCDFADPSMVVGRRNVSTVAPQSLLLMNHPFVMEQARLTADRLLGDATLDDSARLTRLYRLAIGRVPSDRERAIGLRFIAGQTAANRQQSWTLLVQAVFASLDFRYSP